MTIDQLVREAHTTAIDRGWWIFPRTPLEIHALIHREVSEATEEVCRPVGAQDRHLEELADVIIRIADYCGYKNWDLTAALERKLAYNRMRPFRHGGKRA